MLGTEDKAVAVGEHTGGAARDTSQNPQLQFSSQTEIVRSANKRAFDIAVAVILLIAFFPLLLSAFIGIKLESRGPALFRQRRTGLSGEVFTILKFRTMRVLEDSHEITQASKGDPRVTPLGSLLRRTSIDELPQLINVLRGDMSIVGPRPHALAHDTHYGLRVHNYTKRFRTRPGLTGFAQVSGLRGETADVDDMANRIIADNHYIDNWDISLDFDITLRTAKLLLLSDQKAY